MSDYVPSTEEVREQYWAASGDARRDPKSWAEFDSWLADHDMEVRTQTLVAARQIAKVRGSGAKGEPSDAQVTSAKASLRRGGVYATTAQVHQALRAAGEVGR